MSKLKIAGWIFSVVLIVVVVLSFVLNSAAGSSELTDPIIEVVVEKGDVWRKASDRADFQKVTGSEQVFASDIIKTGVNSVARISFFETEEVMMDENSEIIITEGFIDLHAPLYTQVKVKLRKGQIWSRLIELLHPQAAFEVEAGTIVATVRGTSFNVALGETYITVFVYENEVGIFDLKKQKGVAELKAGDEFKYNIFDGDYETKSVDARELMESQRENPWIYNNMIMNKEFKNYLNYNRNYILDKIGSLPGEKFYRLKLAAEKLDAWLSFDKKKHKQTVLNKRAIEATALIDRGETQAAIRFLHANDINLRTCPEFTRLQTFDTRLKERLVKYPEVKLFMMNSAFSAAEQGFIAAKLQQLDPQKLNELEPPVLNQDATAPSEGGSTNDNNQSGEPALGAGENDSTGGQTVAPAPTEPPETTVQSQPPTPASPKIELKSDPVIVPIVQKPEPAKPASLEVEADKVNLSAGGKSTLTAYLVYSDKTKKDVTRDTVWSLGPDELTQEYAGSLAGNVFSANDTGGKAYVKGTYRTIDGQSFSGTVTLTVLILNATNQ